MKGQEDVRLILGDCLDVLPTLEKGSVDAVITDPPFGIDFDYDGKKDVAKNPAEYWKWLKPRWVECLRCVKPGGFVAVWQAQPYFRFLWEWFGEGIHIYAACKNFVQMRKTPINYGYDPVVMFYKPGGDPLRPSKPQRNVDFFVADTAGIIGQSTGGRNHPCPRPLDQVRIIVDNFAVEGGTVLDPFMGSGTTGVACSLTGRKFIGIEKEPLYLALAERRMAHRGHGLQKRKPEKGGLGLP